MATQQKNKNTNTASKGKGRTTSRKPPRARKAEEKTVEPTSQPTSVISSAASKAKGPLIAGGAALAGLAGGLVLANRNSKSRGPSLPRLGNGGSTAKALGSVAAEIGKAGVEIGKAGYRLGEFTTEVRKIREQVSQD
jgi:hypothetical protein